MLEEEESCPYCDSGIMILKIEGCSCHINPPCSACTDAPLVCDKCGYEQEAPKLKTPISDEAVKRHIVSHKPAEQLFAELPNKKFGYIRYPSPDGWGMTVKGKMPDGMTATEVLKGSGVCEHGCPHFYKFNDNEFMFTYTYN